MNDQAAEPNRNPVRTASPGPRAAALLVSDPAPAAPLLARPTTIADLSREQFGLRVTCERGTGWLYAIHDDWNDGYPSRTLIVVTSEQGDDATWQFTDSDPSGYPKTMSTPVDVSDD